MAPVGTSPLGQVGEGLRFKHSLQAQCLSPPPQPPARFTAALYIAQVVRDVLGTDLVAAQHGLPGDGWTPTRGDKTVPTRAPKPVSDTAKPVPDPSHGREA